MMRRLERYGTASPLVKLGSQRPLGVSRPSMALSASGGPSPEVVGRNGELEAIDRFLDRLDGGPSAIVFEGPPGIGKTTLWRELSERAASRSLTMLSCRPVEAETKLAFASLADLLEPVAESILSALPSPQRLALEVALMRASPPGIPPSPRAVATAVLSALRALAAATPVLLAIDDQQWLDRATAEALAFALRRIGNDRIGVAAAVRIEDGDPPDPLALARAFSGRAERLRLGPLGLGALHHVIRTHLDHVFARPMLRRIHEASDGNPLFALEIARTVREAAAPLAASEPLPVPQTLASLLVRRFERLPAHTRDLLLVVSALSAPTVDVVRKVADGTAWARATQARMIDVRGDRVAFTHPLLASAVYGSVGPDKRRALHRRLAALVPAPEERARHLALAAVEPDEDVARALDEAAVLARRRGAPDTAGELAEQAARLTSDADPPARRRRLLQAAEHFIQAGDRPRARTLLDGVLGDAGGDHRATALRLLARIRGQEESFAAAIACLDEARAHAADAEARVAVELDLAYACYNGGDLPRAVLVARDALAGAERLGAPGLLADALASVVMSQFITGLGIDRAGLERALALEDRSRATELEARPSSVAGMLAVYEGRLHDGETLLREICSWAAERGEESGLPFLLLNLCWLEAWRGRFPEAIAWAEEARVIAEQSGSEASRALALVHRGRVRAISGDVSGARADMHDAQALLDETGYVLGVPWLLASQAMLELSLGDAEAAARTAAPLVALVEAVGIGDPFVASFVPDAVEALTRVGEVARARPLLEVFTDRAQALERRWALASAARSRSILTAAHGELDAAVAAAEDAIALGESLDMPVELGRSLLALGQVRRRRGDRRLARAAFERSRDVFRGVGASRWAERAVEELGRIPIRRGAPDELTPTEERVAALAAAGRRNVEVAKTLFMSPKTVEANLARIYRKLGIRTRAELGARMQERRITPAEDDRRADPARGPTRRT